MDKEYKIFRIAENKEDMLVAILFDPQMASQVALFLYDNRKSKADDFEVRESDK